jgi:hypothetical protein
MGLIVAFFIPGNMFCLSEDANEERDSSTDAVDDSTYGESGSQNKEASPRSIHQRGPTDDEFQSTLNLVREVVDFDEKGFGDDDLYKKESKRK